MNRSDLHRYIFKFFGIVFLFLMYIPSLVFAEGGKIQKVKVGFFAYDGYHEQASNDKRSGYGYDFFQLTRRYADVDYEYVGYYNSAEECIKMLEEGKIDIYGPARKTPELQHKYDFSLPIGTNRVELNVQKDEQRYTPGNYSTYNGMVIGMLKGVALNASLFKYAQDNGFSFTPKYYNSASDLESALASKEIDAIATSSLRRHSGEKVIDEFATDYFYAIVKKGNKELLGKLNNAIYQMDNAEGDWKSKLFYRNYTAKALDTLYFTDKEKELIEKYSKGNKKLYIATDENWAPFSYYSNGVHKGIAPDYLSKLLQMTGMKYEFVTGNKLSDASVLADKRIDLYLCYSGDIDTAEAKGIVVTPAYMELSAAFIHKKGISTFNKIAICQNTPALNSTLRVWSDQTVITYSDSKSAVKAVEQGDVDAAYIYSLEAERIANSEYSGVLEYQILSGTTIPLRMAAVSEKDRTLIGILSKCIGQLEQSYINNIVTNHISYSANKLTITSWIKMHPFETLYAVLAIFLAVCIGIYITMRNRARAEEAIELQEQEHRHREQIEIALKAAEHANQAKTTFLNSMSHDIRTPMNGIIGMTAIALTHLDDKDRVKECLGKISGASNHLLALINDILDMSRIESGRVALAEEIFSLSDLMDNMLNMLAGQAKSKKQELIIRTHGIVHEEIIGDSLRLQQVFMNIVGNAIKYTPEGGQIEVDLTEKLSDSNTYGNYTLTCRDNGYGMKPEFVEHIFEPFSRAEDEHTKNIAGTGLGMVITRNIVRMMDGDIKVESEYGKGSVFTIDFRLRKQNISESSQEALAGTKILFVDDNEDSCNDATAMLKSIGMCAESAYSGYEAVDKVQKAHAMNKDYSVCLIDWQMPGMDGIETTRRIRALVGGEIPIIVISAYDWSDIEMEARAAGVDDFIAKPLFRSRLTVKLTELLTKEEHKENNALDTFVERDFSDKRLLLVEDNELNREIAVEILGMTGAAIETAEDGKQALRLFEDHEPGYYDLIFMDINMPVMNGYEATRAIRSLDRKDAHTIPIVAMSANAFKEDMESSKLSGMNAHIAKPINMGTLMGVMENYLGKHVQRFNKKVEECKQKADFKPAKYYEELYFTNGATVISEDTEKACVDVLDKNGAVGIFGLLEQKDYPIYCASGFALTSLGYSYEELLEVTKGYFIELVYPEDRKALVSEFYKDGYKHHYRILAKGGRVLMATSYSTDTYLMDGSKVRMLSLRIGKSIMEQENVPEQVSRWKESIIASIEKNALYMYEFDVTTGLVGQDIIGDNGKNYSAVLGLKAPCKFDDLISKSLVTNLKCNVKSINSLKTLNCAHLLEAFANGEASPEVDFYYTVDEEYHRLTYYMTKDEESGHVKCLVVCHKANK